VASTLSSEDRDTNFKQAHTQAVVAVVRDNVAKKKNREDKKIKYELKMKEKSDILKAFKEDHDIDDSKAFYLP